MIGYFSILFNIIFRKFFIVYVFHGGVKNADAKRRSLSVLFFPSKDSILLDIIWTIDGGIARADLESSFIRSLEEVPYSLTNAPDFPANINQ
ncbi:hypothetical protein BpHYR1_009163 [Brachionus plicatilis]|uniref:Uncharacterized protein n=1 Tax=Brachionus plicatilis TaxID=10195 RepID=A0A3M7PGN0_BRAPC|nr:hypothetical protein BpHYR1_009163 [Brachionus plicatilis]